MTFRPKKARALKVGDRVQARDAIQPCMLGTIIKIIDKHPGDRLGIHVIYKVRWANCSIGKHSIMAIRGASWAHQTQGD